MMCLWFPGRSWMAALTGTLMALSPFLTWARDTPPNFLEHVKCECHFSNGTERVRFLERHVYNGKEFLRFDSDVGEYRALTELGRPEAKSWNRQEDLMERKRAAVDWFCRVSYRISERFLVHRQRLVLLWDSAPRVRESPCPSRFPGRTTSVVVSAAPTVTVYPAKTRRLQHHNLLVCSVNGFYPGHIDVRWLQDGQEQEAGVVSTGLIRNGDWTFQILVMLETVPQSGEVYTCQVQHPSRTSPLTAEWRAQSGSAQSKMLSGVGGFVLGLLFLGAGLFVYFRNQKGHSGLQPAGLLS